MNGTAARFLRLGVSMSGLVLLACVLAGHAAKPARHSIPVPTDWSHSHLIFSRPASAEQAARLSEDPRYLQQIFRREQPRVAPEVANLRASVFAPLAVKGNGKKFKRDWAADIGAGASVGAGNYPAKFSLDGTVANCATDYVAYSTGLTGVALGQANIVAFNNLYNGCGGTVPSVYWAYNTAGQVLTSPVVSRDGSQIAFVQTDIGQVGTLVIVRWAASTGSISSAATPTLEIPSAYVGCTAPCMTTVILRDSSNLITDDTTSSVFYDYTNDIAWVGGARGWLHKITGVFNGIPTEVHGGGFPVQLNPGNATALASPVYDHASQKVFVTDAGGFLYSVDSTGTVTASAQLDHGTGFVEGPIVDSSNGFVYAFASSDGSSNCNAGAVACSAVYQFSTSSFTAGGTGSEVTVGNSVVLGSTPNPMYIGGFDSAYYNSTNATGNLYVCGNTGSNATLYQVPIQAGAFPLSGLGLTVTTLAPGTSTAACSPVTDIPNPNTTGGPSERLFVSVQNNGQSTACAAGGCVLNFVSAPWQASKAYGVGQQVLSSKFHAETVIVAGTSAATPPNWTTSAGSTRSDGGIVWIDQGFLTANTIQGWTASFHYPSTTSRIIDTNSNIQVSTTNTGTTGSSPPVWNTIPGGTTLDNTVVWTNVGPVATFALSSAGGTSGIIVDNTVNGSLGTSQIYFSTLAGQCGVGGTDGCAVQASQTALQ